MLSELKDGSSRAELELFPLVYDELHGLAAHYMRRERAEHTLQATALLHEAYLRLVQEREINYRDRSHFFAVAAQAMRRVLVDHARARSADKRGGGRRRVSFDDALILSEEKPEALIALDEALTRLAKLDAQQSRIVELRFFGGLTEEETASVLGISSKTVKRDWSVARAWLHRELTGGSTT